MKINDFTRYPHPVLSEFSNDYVSAEFRCKFMQQITGEGELKLSASLDLNSAELSQLITKQVASPGYFVVCRETYFNRLVTVPLGESERYIAANELFGKVTIRPVVWATKNVEGFSSPLIHKEFGETSNVPKGSVIALGPEFSFSIDKKKFKPFESIFDLAKDEKILPGTISVDPTGERITILADSATYEGLASMRNLSKGRDILLSAVYAPALADVICELRLEGGKGLQSTHWYRIFKAKCDDLGIDPIALSETPLVLAQRLLRAPLKKVISAVEAGL